MSCHQQKQDETTSGHHDAQHTDAPVIVDCDYTFQQATAGSSAPQEVLDELQLFKVRYYSFDGKLHCGQVLCNNKIARELKSVFQLIEKTKFPVGKVIPVVRYNWDDDASMADNNSYSFCYRNVGYSKHAYGMAMDINPFQNPVRWNEEYASTRRDKPEGAVYNPDTPGTFTPDHPVVHRFEELGFRWGRTFRRNDDDHHFEK